MKISRVAGTTNEILQFFVRDSSSTIGAGLAGLTNASSGLTGYYCRNNQGTATSISIVSMTLGTYTSGGFKELDGTNMPGWYQFCPPDAVFTSGRSAAIHLKGATNMAPLPIEVEITAWDNQNAASGGLSRIDAAISSRSVAGDAMTLTAAYDLAKTASQAGDAMTLTAAYNFAKGTTAMTESYPVKNATITPVQALYFMVQDALESSIAGTTKTLKKRDQSTTAKTGTLDSSTAPTSITEAT